MALLGLLAQGLSQAAVEVSDRTVIGFIRGLDFFPVGCWQDIVPHRLLA